MKKIILIIAGAFAFLTGNSQSGTANLEKAKYGGNTGIVEPTINGKPYSQYKAEQEALKKEREAKITAAKTKNADAASITVTNTATNTNVAPATREAKKGPDDENTAPTAKQEVQNPDTKKEVKPADVKQPQVPDQFKLPVAKPWPATNVPDKSTSAGANVQPVNTQVPDTKAESTTPPPAKKQN